MDQAGRVGSGRSIVRRCSRGSATTRRRPPRVPGARRGRERVRHGRRHRRPRGDPRRARRPGGRPVRRLVRHVHRAGVRDPPSRADSIVVLDAAFDDSFDPFARDAAAALSVRGPRCVDGTGTARGSSPTSRALARRSTAIRSSGPVSTGAAYPIRLHPPGTDLAQLLYDATYVFTIYRDFPAALAALRGRGPRAAPAPGGRGPRGPGRGREPAVLLGGRLRGDRVPRLPVALGPDGRCRERRAQLADAAIEALPDDAFAPFPTTSGCGSPYEDALVRGCLRWPAPPEQGASRRPRSAHTPTFRSWC